MDFRRRAFHKNSSPDFDSKEERVAGHVFAGFLPTFVMSVSTFFGCQEQQAPFSSIPACMFMAARSKTREHWIKDSSWICRSACESEVLLPEPLQSEVILIFQTCFQHLPETTHSFWENPSFQNHGFPESYPIELKHTNPPRRVQKRPGLVRPSVLPWNTSCSSATWTF